MAEPPRVGRQLVFGILVQALFYARGLIVMPIIIKLAGEAVYGAYVLLGAMLTLLLGISGFGTRYGYWRNLPAAHGMAERSALMMPQLWFQAGTITLFCGALIAVMPALGAALLGPGLAVSPAWIAAWLVALFLLAQGTDYFRYTLRLGVFNAATLGHVVLYTAAVAGAAILGVPLSLDLVVALQVVALLLVAVPVLGAALRETGLSRPRQRIGDFVRQARTGFPLVLEFVADLVLAAGDRYLIALFLSVAAVGQYQPAYQLAILLCFLPKYFGIVLPPALSRLVDAGDQAGASRLFDRFMHLFLIVAIPFVAGCTMVGPSLVALLATPAAAEASRLVMPLVSLAAVPYGIMILVSYAAFVLGRTRQVLEANLIAIGVSLGLCALLLPHYPGLVVPAATTLVGYALAGAYAVRFARAHWPVHWRYGLVARALAAAGIMALGLALLGFPVAAPATLPAGIVLLAVPLAAGLYFAVLALLGGLDRSLFLDLMSGGARGP
ncbi:lipopolysaccharide biosynthesis protein [Zavarzinia sp. CC-PAN008]|uniref:lipopolysaccharide biosynthesis protein n=1 Tax=Zavarzinia sp. CC-PAN008 TaxID=3243332 RepID=UPI003F7451C0